MNDLAEWLLEQIAVDEHAARTCAAVYSSPWNVNDRGHSATVVADGPNFLIVADLDQDQANMGAGSDAEWVGERLEHLARWDPARVLAECDAKRRIVEDATRLCRHDPLRRGDYWRGTRDTATAYLCLLALPYADRPGYREEWAA